ncbi:c-type cytochrome [Variovorax sp. 54]|uniref:c-type cytochrome n=1 Tax=Variovorax sp. 54 TaxID=2035212 RepID=UPI000C197376|nr:c-type cytochrome [Variovorax sp. 54]
MAASSGAAAQQPQPSPVDLARKNACMACHGLVHKQVGPGFAQIADRYRNDATAPARLADKIRNGSVGTWGRVIMPRQSLVSEAEAQVLARWVLAQTQQPPAR